MKIPSWIRGAANWVRGLRVTPRFIYAAIAIVLAGILLSRCPGTDTELAEWQAKATIALSQRDSLAKAQEQITREVDGLRALRASTGRIGARIDRSSRRAADVGRDLVSQADTAESLLVANLL